MPTEIFNYHISHRTKLHKFFSTFFGRREPATHCRFRKSYQKPPENTVHLKTSQNGENEPKEHFLVDKKRYEKAWALRRHTTFCNFLLMMHHVLHSRFFLCLFVCHDQAKSWLAYKMNFECVAILLLEKCIRNFCFVESAFKLLFSEGNASENKSWLCGKLLLWRKIH